MIFVCHPCCTLVTTHLFLNAHRHYFLQALLFVCVCFVHTCVCVCVFPLRKIITSCASCHYEPGCPTFLLTAWLQQVNYMSLVDDVTMLATFPRLVDTDLLKLTWVLAIPKL